jgi:hypothetical protein
VSRGPDFDDLAVEDLDRAIDRGILERSLCQLSQRFGRGRCFWVRRRFTPSFGIRLGGFDLDPNRVTEEFRAGRFE